MNKSTPFNRVRIWDLPTRLFHWTLAVCVLGLIVTGKIGEAQLDLHARFGYAVLALISFRILWGLLGGRWSRFSQFVPSPARLWAYARGRWDAPAGHNPLGALSVLGMLGVFTAQVCTGLIIDDEISFTGPLYALAPSNWVSVASHYHKSLGQALVISLVVLHLVAIIWHTIKHRRRLVQAMVTGDQEVGTEVTPSRDDLGSRLGALMLFAACLAGTWALISLGSPSS